MSKINKALDYNKLLEQQAQGKLLKKILKFPLYASIKYDGNYTTIRVENGITRHYSSGNHLYTHANNTAFMNVSDGVYLAERIAGEGKLGDRDRCALEGPRDNQHAKANNTYRVFDYLTIDEYNMGHSTRAFSERGLASIPMENIAINTYITCQVQLYAYLKKVVNDGFEGLMLMQPDWKWEDTKSRRINFCKLKKRRTADLLCIGTEEGEGKYEGQIGALVLRDSNHRVVSVGSGLSDFQRITNKKYFIGKVFEIEFERIAKTYIQPTLVREREDKTQKEID